MRLGVKESELFRYAVKNMLTKLMPLSDDQLNGSDLMPAWLECGHDLLNYFHIDVEQLNDIFNKNICANDERVDMTDLDLMILSVLNRNYVIKKLSAICQTNIKPSEVDEALNNYLYEKYVSNEMKTSRPVDFSLKKINPSLITTTN